MFIDKAQCMVKNKSTGLSEGKEIIIKGKNMKEAIKNAHKIYPEALEIIPHSWIDNDGGYG